MLSLMVFAAFATLSSCGNDEPDNSVIDYYLRIEEEFLVDGSTSHTDRYFNPVTRMKSAMTRNLRPIRACTQGAKST